MVKRLIQQIIPTPIPPPQENRTWHFTMQIAGGTWREFVTAVGNTYLSLPILYASFYFFFTCFDASIGQNVHIR